MNSNKGRPQRKSSASQTEGVFYVEGMSAVSEFICHAPDKIIKIEIRKKDAGLARQQLAALVALDTLPITEIENAKTQIQASVRIEALDFTDWLRENALALREHDTVIAIDHITDPRNLGAIVRTAAFFGIRTVLVPNRRQVLLTGASVATAQGGFALTNLVVCVNLSRALDDLKKQGYWAVGAAGDGEPMATYAGKFERQVLVFGAEDKGLSDNIRSHCDCIVAIAGAEKRVESLNVSVAAGVLIHSFFAP